MWIVVGTSGSQVDQANAKFLPEAIESLTGSLRSASVG